MSDIEIVQTREGTPHVHKNKYGEAKNILIGREWKVLRDGVEVGRVRYGLITRERKTPGWRYVNARWQTPGWEWQVTGHRYWSEETSKKRCIEWLTM